MDPDSSNILSQILLLGFLTLLNAFFAAAEMAVVSLNKNRMAMLSEQGNKKATLLLGLIDEPTKFLSTIQVGITLAGFFASASAATGLSKDFGNWLSSLSIPYGSQIALIVVTLILSYFTLVFGELFPKRIALKNSEKIAMGCVKPILFLSMICSPFIKLLSGSTNLLVRLFGNKDTDLDERVTKEEIKSILDSSERDGVINETEKGMIDGIFRFDDRLAREIMTPRTDVYMIDLDEPVHSWLDEMMMMKYSRIPVYQNSNDNIVGILYSKDFSAEAKRVGFENVDIHPILKPAYFVPENKRLDILFQELQKNRTHFAVLIDEYGGFSGIVTIEDLIEQIMGEIEDEFDEETPPIERINEHTYVIDGLTPIDVLNEELDLHLVSDISETISGFLTEQIGVIPKEQFSRPILYNNLSFTILGVKEKRIEKVQLSIH